MFAEENILGTLTSACGATLKFGLMLEAFSVQNTKENFKVGEFHLFDETYNGHYSTFLNSKSCFNLKLDWTPEYFSKILCFLRGEGPEKSGFFEVEFMISGSGNAPGHASEHKEARILKIFHRPSNSKIKSLLFCAEMARVGPFSTESLFEIASKLNSRTKYELENVKGKLNVLIEEQRELIMDLKALSKAKEENRDELLSKAFVLVNEKKEKIVELLKNKSQPPPNRPKTIKKK